MLAIAFVFPAGRYHATPWGRHVNEADVAWPPEPWRLLRALVATWHRKLDPEMFPEPLLESLLHALASELPSYRLPTAVHSHTRHYMPVREGKTDKKVLIFDAFVRVDARDPLIVAWPGLTLDASQQALLDALLDAIGYLGRAESWVEARRLPDYVNGFHCIPGGNGVDEKTGELFEPVQLLVPRATEVYRAWREGFLEASPAKSKKGRAALRGLPPERLIDALRLDTGDLQNAGWNLPPAAERALYHRPAGCLAPVRPAAIGRRFVGNPTTARFLVEGKPLPLATDVVKIGELVRWAAMGVAKHLLGEDKMPPVLSGHGLSSRNSHGHAFYLPEANDEGRIDHIVIHAESGLDDQARQILDALRRAYTRDGQEWRLVLEGLGSAAEFANASRLLRESTVWRSATPYLHPWFAKKGFRIADQLRRECRIRGLPEAVEVRSLDTIPVGRKQRRPVHFHRFRTKRGLMQPDTHGSFWQIAFAEPVRGPLALGFACHFGLGLFTPCTEA